MSLTDVRLTAQEREAIRQAVAEAASRFGVRWKRISLFGSRTDPTARGGDIDLYLEVNASDVDLDAFIRTVRLQLHERLGEQKVDVVVDDGRKDLGSFGQIIRRTKVDLWTMI